VNKLVKKFATVGIAVATTVSLAGLGAMPVAGAATIAELEALVAQLQAELAALTSGGSGGGTCYTWTRSLTIGSQGTDVTNLQTYLMGTGHFTFAGGATGYFGPITQAAVAAWQSANGVAPAAGYFGPISQAMYATMCGDDDGGDMDDDFFSGDDEGNLAEFDQISHLTAEEVGEGQDEVSILGFEIEAEGADQRIQRVNVVFDTPTDAAQDDLDDFITGVSLWLDGDMIGEMDVDEASHDRSADEYTFRFVGLMGDIDEGDTVDLEVAVDAVNNVNADTDMEGWTVEITSIRAASPNGTDEVYDDTAGTTETFTLEEFASSENIELKARRSSDSPVEQVQVGQDDDEFEADFLVFTLEAKNSDFTIYSLEFDLTAIGGPDTDHMAQNLMLACDGEDWSETVPDAGAATDDIVFDNLEIEIDEGDTLECTVSGTMSEIDGAIFTEGAGMSVDLDVSETDADDAVGETVGAGDLTGSANGYDQTFLSNGPFLDDFSATANVTVVADDASETGQGTFIIEFDVTANESDVWLDKSIEEVTDDGAGDDGEGIVYTATSSGGATFTVLSETFSCVSSCGSSTDNSAGNWYIAEGDTERYRVKVVLEGQDATPDDYKVYLSSVNWAATDITADQFYTTQLGEDTDADTGWLYINSEA